jgi:hypothetical protein
MLTNVVVMHHDNARSHTVVVIAEMVQKLKFELLPHPVYRQYLTPSDYHINGPIKNVLHGCQFVNSKMAKDMVHKWTCSQLETFFTDGIGKLMD